MTAPANWIERGRVALQGVVLGVVLWVVISPPATILSSDWTDIATGAHLLLSSPSHLYDLHAQRIVQAQIIGGQSFLPPNPGGLLPYWFPPWVAILALPFIHFGDVVGGRLWMLSELLALAAGLWLMTGRGRRYAVMAGLGGFPMAALVVTGQVDGLVVLGVGAGWALWRGGRPVEAGLVMTLTLAKPHLVLPLAVGVLLAGQWRVLGGWLLGGAVLAAASFALDTGWLLQLFHAVALARLSLWIPGLVTDAGGPSALVYASAAAATVLVLLLTAKVKRVENRTAFVIAGGLLAAPHALIADLVLIVPAILVAEDGGFLLWLVLSAGGLAVALVQPPELAAALSVLLIAGYLVRLGWPHRMPVFSRDPAVVPAGAQESP